MAKTRRAATTKKRRPAQPAKAQGFPIVGIGASAGGLEAFEAFLQAMPVDSGVAFVLVAHLDPTHASILPELLQKRTRMAVCVARNGMRVQPNEVYVIPPNKELNILNGTLRLFDFEQMHGARLPIDSFFRSLAQDQGSNAIGIVLSGTGSDGTQGLKEIKGAGGVAMVQDQKSAKYDGMPRSAIDTGLADFILPPAHMPEKLVAYAKRLRGGIVPPALPPTAYSPDALQKIFIILRSSTGHDFSRYKQNTILRRVERRMNVHQIDDIAEYVRYLRESEREVGVLFRELLINVTSFFRDAEAFDILRTKVLMRMLKGKPDDYMVRMWVPGCSSGEEAYSVAIAVQECMRNMKRRFPVQIFGTDIDANAIDAARAGIYPPSVRADIDPAILKRYLIKEDDGHYRVAKSIREMLVFAPQSIIKDPPFTKLDLISCRNLLIYLGTELQRQVIPLLHYALKPNGYLFLGSSETIGTFTDLFTVVDKKWRIYARGPASAATRFFVPRASARADAAGPEPRTFEAMRNAEEISALKVVETILQQTDTPPCAVIDDTSNVIYIHGRTGRFLEPAEGKANVNILDMARPGLKTELAVAIRRVSVNKRSTVCRGIKIKNNGGHIFVDLTVKPILERTAKHGMMMAVFQEVEPLSAKGRTARTVEKKHDKSIEELEQELHYTREDLQTTIEEIETANEELKSTNEELQSTNEELQSTNEELETSKEELQSLNEEAATVNAELQSRIDDLARANDDMRNLLESTDLAILFLDANLGVRRFTARTADLFPLTAADIGRPINHFVSDLMDVDISRYAESVLGDLAVREADVTSKSGRTLHMLVRPYRTTSNVIDGAVVTFQDITELTRAKDEVKKLADANERRLITVVRDSNDAITVQDLEGRITAWNRGAERMYGYSEEEALAMNIADIVPDGKKREALAFIAGIGKSNVLESFETQRKTKDGRILDVWLTVTRLTDGEGHITAVATTERDITGRGQAGKRS